MAMNRRGPTRWRLNLDALRQHYEDNDLDDLAVCWATGIPPTTIWRLRTGRTQLCTTDTLERLLDGLKMPFKDLVLERVGRAAPGTAESPRTFELHRNRRRRLTQGA